MTAVFRLTVFIGLLFIWTSHIHSQAFNSPLKIHSKAGLQNDAGVFAIPQPVSTITYSDYLHIEDTVVHPFYDLSIAQIVQPGNEVAFFDSITVVVKVKNLGLTARNDIPLSYNVGHGLTLVNEIWHGITPLAPDSSITYTFNHRYRYNYLGYYWLCAYHSDTADLYRQNDTVCKIIEQYFIDSMGGINNLSAIGLMLGRSVPNPADTKVEIPISLPYQGMIVFEIVNCLGQKMFGFSERMPAGQNKLEINTAAYPAGMYFYSLKFDGRLLAGKMLIEK